MLNKLKNIKLIFELCILLYFGLSWFSFMDVSLGAWLDYLNRKSASSPIPSELEGIYDDEKYHKQQNYFIANNKLVRFPIYWIWV